MSVVVETLDDVIKLKSKANVQLISEMRNGKWQKEMMSFLLASHSQFSHSLWYMIWSRKVQNHEYYLRAKLTVFFSSTDLKLVFEENKRALQWTMKLHVILWTAVIWIFYQSFWVGEFKKCLKFTIFGKGNVYNIFGIK